MYGPDPLLSLVCEGPFWPVAVTFPGYGVGPEHLIHNDSVWWVVLFATVAVHLFVFRSSDAWSLKMREGIQVIEWARFDSGGDPPRLWGHPHVIDFFPRMVPVEAAHCAKGG